MDQVVWIIKVADSLVDPLLFLIVRIQMMDLPDSAILLTAARRRVQASPVVKLDISITIYSDIHKPLQIQTQ